MSNRKDISRTTNVLGIIDNQEDSVLFNKGAIERGLFTITVYKTYTAEEKNLENQIIETIEAPFDSKCIDKSKNYLKLDEQGIIREKSIVEENDVIICKSIRSSGKLSERVDASMCHKLEEKGFVDKVLITKNADGNKLVRVRVGFHRIPIFGDKFASVHAQKGTVSMILPPEDMPFTASGIVPDLIINSHSQVSRMTISHLIECVTGKCAVVSGEFQDATPFNEDEGFMMKHLNKVGDELTKRGFQRHGEEAMMNGMTGELLKGTIFIGPTYYRRLKHMILDKLSARAEGPNQMYTRQPANQGRKNGKKYTSIKFGTMEADAMGSHGASNAIQERLLLSSDKYITSVCNKCGFITSKCKCGAGTTEVVMPYAFKLLHHNITALQIKASIKTENSI